MAPNKLENSHSRLVNSNFIDKYVEQMLSKGLNAVFKAFFVFFLFLSNKIPFAGDGQQDRTHAYADVDNLI